MQPTPTLTRSKRSARVWGLLGILGLVVVIAGLRWQGIEVRPVHTDEAENAWILAEDRSGAGYVFDPHHHHGPTLNAWLRLPAEVMGYRSFSQMEMLPLRASVWLAGLLTLLVLVTFRPLLGQAGAAVAVVLAGCSGFLTYYGNTVIHETLLGGLAIAALAVMVRWVQRPTWLGALMIGVIAGAMLATKQTALICFASWAGAVVLLVASDRGSRTALKLKAWGLQLGLAALVALVVAGLFYTDFLRHPGGASDALRSLWSYQTESGHEKPWSYYLTHLILPIERAPFGSYEWGLWLLALVGVSSMRFREGRSVALSRPTRRLAVFLTGSIVLQLGLYSLVSYKTPWLMLVLWLHAALLAGIGFRWLLTQRSILIRWGSLVLLAVLVVMQIRTTQVLNTVYHSDPRNPLAYAPTSGNLLYLPAFLEDQLKSMPVGSDIGVIGDFIWPLPWYLRTMEGIRYYPGTVSRPYEHIWILTDASYAALEPGWIRDRAVYPFSLRPSVPLYVCLMRNSSETALPDPNDHP